jgi:hypothetical protein
LPLADRDSLNGPPLPPTRSFGKVLNFNSEAQQARSKSRLHPGMRTRHTTLGLAFRRVPVSTISMYQAVVLFDCVGRDTASSLGRHPAASAALRQKITYCVKFGSLIFVSEILIDSQGN